MFAALTPNPKNAPSPSPQWSPLGRNSGSTWHHEDTATFPHVVAGRIDCWMGGKAVQTKEFFLDPNYPSRQTIKDIDLFPREIVLHFDRPRPDIKKIREAQSGLRIFVQTCKRWGLDQEGQLALLGYNSTDPAGKNVLAGHVPIDPQPLIDRVAHIIAISIGLGILYDENIDAEKQWLKTPRRILGNRSPFGCMQNTGMDDLITINRMVERERGL